MIYDIIKKILFKISFLRTRLIGLQFKRFGQGIIFFYPIKIHNKENVSIGNNCSLNAFVHIWGGGGLEIGDNVMIASHVSINTITHDYNKEVIRFAPNIYKSVIIEDDVWIGSSAIIMPGIRIGQGAVIGAGSVITKDVPSRAIIIGNPGRVLKMRN
jgi:maltose O-acetyltransferase